MLHKFAIQLDESTDVSSCAQLLVFARYIKEGDFKDEFLFCHPLESTTKGEDIFNAVSKFFLNEGISWDNVCACTTDGAPAMLGYRSGFRSRVIAVNSTAKHLHCMIHRHALASKTLPPELKEVLDDVVSMVNAIKSSALNTRLFRLLCQEFDENHEELLLHTEVRWLSRGNMLSRVESLKEEMAEFFSRIGSNIRYQVLASKLTDQEWLVKLAYLSDVFTRLNELNKSLQGSHNTVIDFVDKLRAFLMKLQLWEANASEGKFTMFDNLAAILNEKAEVSNIQRPVMSHLSSLRNQFQNYFPDLSDLDLKMARNPFTVDVKALPDSAQEQFIDFINDSTARDAFETLPLTTFWCRMWQSYPAVAEEPIKLLLMFPSTYLCEQGFSAVVSMKTKFRARLSVAADLQVALSKTTPRIEALVAAKQAQQSH